MEFPQNISGNIPPSTPLPDSAENNPGSASRGNARRGPASMSNSGAIVWLMLLAGSIFGAAWMIDGPLSGLTAGPAFSGSVREVVNGQSFRMGDKTVRLWGIEAPDDERLAQAAAQSLIQAVRGREVTCVPLGAGVDPVSAKCRIGQVDVNSAMVFAGWARDHKLVSAGTYASYQADAARNRRGMWKYLTPEEVAAAAAVPDPVASSAPQGGQSIGAMMRGFVSSVMQKMKVSSLGADTAPLHLVSLGK